MRVMHRTHILNGLRSMSLRHLFLISALLLPIPPKTLSNEVPVHGKTPFDKDEQDPLPSTPNPVPEVKKYECNATADIDCLDQAKFEAISGNGLCSEIQPKIWRRYFPRGQKAAGNYTELGTVSSPEQCAKGCCLDATCHYSLMVDNTCYLLNCMHGSYLCEPVLSSEMAVAANFSMMLVRPPKITSPIGITCEVGENSACKANQKCIPTNHRSRNGICICDNGYIYNGVKKQCDAENEPERVTTKSLSPSPSPSTTTTPPVELAVSVTSRNLTLPENEASLIAYVVPQAPADRPYSYKWNLISNPMEDTATVEGHNTDTLRLTGLKEGSYIFQVTAFTAQSNGSANATINVFPERKPNLAPIAVISPQEQTIQLPTSSAVLDASLSTDDDKIVSYKWELQKGPILYTLRPSKSMNSSTFQVESLIPGNYTFKLTVEDSEHLTNSTTANVTVIKEPDYPPTANPGKDIVIYLPQTEVILNGNASTDDKKIAEWEWKATGEQTKAIDMQDTHTPYLKLSHLQVGLYQFELKVTDEAGQFSTATVHVVVKESTGTPPKADAGTDETIVLNKQNWAILDGSKSRSESNKIQKYVWLQLSGPNNATISPLGDGVTANVSQLTKGEYEFVLEVEDESKLKSNDTVKINVIQRVNEPPHANAGGNKNIRLPVTHVQLDGSASTDDVKIVSWSWERQPDSLAAGIVLEGSDKTPVLQLTDLVPGKYVFKLTVKDELGASDEDTATLIVEGETLQKDLIEIVLGASISQLTEADKDKIMQQLALILHDANLNLDHMEAQMHSGNVVLHMHGEDKDGNILNGSALAQQLRKKLYQDSGIIQFPVYSVDTVLCLDECSGHGVCEDTPEGRECVCNVFWMENFIKRRSGSRERNCEWSKIYVGVVVSLLLSMGFALIWSLAYIFRRNFGSLKDSASEGGSPRGSPLRGNGKRHSHKRQYTLLDDDELELQAHDDEDDMESEDSDSDVLFESSKRSKSRNGSLMMTPLTSNGTRNGILKNSRRIKA